MRVADKSEPYSKLAKLYAEEIERASQEGAVNLRSWIATLSVGNGAGLLGVFSLAQKTDGVPLLYIFIPSAWLFLLGLGAASASSFGQVALFKKDEEYWRLSDVNRIKEEGDLPPHATDEVLARLDTAVQRWGLLSGYAAIASSIAFLIAVGIPLGCLTYRAIFGVL